MLKDLIKLANRLDSIGLHKEADDLDKVAAGLLEREEIYGDLNDGWNKKAKMPERPLHPIWMYAARLREHWRNASAKALEKINKLEEKDKKGNYKYRDIFDPGAVRAVMDVQNQMVQAEDPVPRPARALESELNSLLRFQRFDDAPATRETRAKTKGDSAWRHFNKDD